MFYVAIYIEDMEGTFFVFVLNMFIICDQDRGHREKSETIDQQGNISIFTFGGIKKDN